MPSPEGAGAARPPPRSPEPVEAAVGPGRQEAEGDVPRLRLVVTPASACACRVPCVPWPDSLEPKVELAESVTLRRAGRIGEGEAGVGWALRERGTGVGPPGTPGLAALSASNKGTRASVWLPLCPVSCCGKMGAIPVIEVGKNNGTNRNAL